MTCIIFIGGLRFIGGIVGLDGELEMKLRFIVGIVGSDEDLEA